MGPSVYRVGVSVDPRDRPATVRDLSVFALVIVGAMICIVLALAVAYVGGDPGVTFVIVFTIFVIVLVVGVGWERYLVEGDERWRRSHSRDGEESVGTPNPTRGSTDLAPTNGAPRR